MVFFTAAVFTGAEASAESAALLSAQRFFVAAIIRFIPSALILCFAFGVSGADSLDTSGVIGVGD